MVGGIVTENAITQVHRVPAMSHALIVRGLGTRWTVDGRYATRMTNSRQQSLNLSSRPIDVLQVPNVNAAGSSAAAPASAARIGPAMAMPRTTPSRARPVRSWT
jgi:hypothetical protein